jgi:hypothetical protein
VVGCVRGCTLGDVSDGSLRSEGKLNVVCDSWKLVVDDVVGCIVFALYFILLFHACLMKKF